MRRSAAEAISKSCPHFPIFGRGMEIYTASQFRRKFKKLPDEIKRRAREREGIFRLDPFNVKLETHKLHGKYSRFWAFSITNTHRIMFEFLRDGAVAFVDIDTHNIYRN